MGIRKDRLKQLKLNCLEKLSLAFEYSSDLNISQDDYSREYSVFEALYSYDVYQRAVSSSPDNASIDEIEESFANLLSALKDFNFEDRAHNYLSHYFSKERYSTILKNLESMTFDGLADDTIESNPNHTAMEYFLIFDKITTLKTNQLVKDLGGDSLQIIEKLYNEISDVFFRFESLWLYYSDTILDELSALLVPNNKEYSYWYKFSAISTLQIESLLNKHVALNREKSLLFSVVKRKAAMLSGDKVKDLVSHFSKSIGELFNIDSFSNIFKEILSSPSLQPAYKTYSKTNDLSSFDLSELEQDFVLNKDSFKTVIEIIEKSNISEEDKKYQISMIYLIIDEADKAEQLIG